MTVTLVVSRKYAGTQLVAAMTAAVPDDSSNVLRINIKELKVRARLYTVT